MARGSTRRLVIPLMRVGVLVLLGVAWLGIFDASDLGEGRRVVLVDRSASVDVETVRRRMREANAEPWRSLREDSKRTSVVEFAGSASAPRSIGDWADAGSAGSDVLGEGTDIARALAAGAAAFRGGDRDGVGRGPMILVTDGRQTAGRAADAAASLAARGIRIDVLAAPMPSDESWIARFDAPLRAANGDIVPIRVQVASTRTVATLGRVVVSREGVEVARADVRVPAAPAGRPASTSVAIENRLAVDGTTESRRSVTYEVVWERFDTDGTPVRSPGDDPRNDRAARRVTLAGPAVVLQIVPRETSSDPPALLDEPSRSRYVLRTTSAPLPAAALEDVAVVVVDDVPAGRDGLDDDSQRRIVDAVRDRGIGLLTRGARSLYGPGGYRGAPLERAFAVECRPEDRSRREVVLLVDRSGSMDEGRKLELAKDAVDGVLEELDAEDRVAVIAFAETANAVVAPGNPADVLARLRERWAGVTPRGETKLADALTVALDAFEAEGAERDLFVITDGKAANDLRSIGRRLASERVRVAVFVTGDEADTDVARLRSMLAEGVEGRITRVVDPRFLESWLREAVAQGDYADRPSNAVARGTGAVARAAVAANGAGIEGWARTTPRDGSEVALGLVDSADALLVAHRFGAGKTAAFMAAPSTSNAPLAGAELWTRIVDAVAPARDADPPIRDVRRDDDRTVVSLRFTRDLPPSEAERLVVRWGDLEAIPRWRSLRFAEAVFQSSDLPLDAPLTLLDGGRVRDSIDVPAFDATELRRYGPDAEALAAIAVAGGGEVLTAGAIPPSSPATSGRPFDGGPWLPLALALLVLERVVTRSSSPGSRAENTI